jgi:[ribosomal protein S5]-alanine N-acetyltransferase
VPVLKGGPIRLRDFVATDWDDLLALADDEAMFNYMKFRIDREWAERSLAWALREQSLTPRPTYSLVVEDADGFVGLAGLGGMRETNEGLFDEYLRSDTDQAEFGWYLSSGRWGRGYATEATALLLRLGFEELGRTRMYATTDPDNLASLRVLQKSGLTSEGLTDPVQTWQGERPRVLCSITAEEWRSRRAAGRSPSAGWLIDRGPPSFEDRRGSLHRKGTGKAKRSG